MKRLLEINVVLLYIFITLGFFYPIKQINAAYLLDNDFSWIHEYCNLSLNPYANKTTEPLWFNDPNISPSGDPGDDAYHTNNLGYYMATGHINNPLDGGLSIPEPGGYRSFTWNATDDWWWWYSLLALTNETKDVSMYDYVTVRYKGKEGGEKFYIQLSDNQGHQGKILVNNVTTNWQSAIIARNLFEIFLVDTKNVTNLALVFSGNDAGTTNKTIYYDATALITQDELNPLPGDGFLKPQSQGPVQIELDPVKQTRKLLVNGNTLRIKGVCYQPTPIGQSPEHIWVDDPGGGYFIPFDPYSPLNVFRDFDQVLQYTGTNTIRTWLLVGSFDPIDPTLMAAADVYNIKVCAGFWIPYEISFLNDWAKDWLKNDFIKYVTAFKDEPELLIWVIGNENNYFNGYDWRWYRFANELAKEAYAIEGAVYHPTAIVEADIDTIGNPAQGSDDSRLNYVDIIGVNSYRGKTFGDLFDNYSFKTAKPLWVAEYGIDAYDNYAGSENQLIQTDFDVSIHIDIERHKKVCIGGTLMEYSDEWWKDPNYSYDVDHLTLHDTGGFVFLHLPDQFANEEWWGMVEVQDNGNNPDIVIPRDVCNRLYSTTLGGWVNMDKYKKAKKVVIKGPVTQTYFLGSDGNYYFTNLAPGKYQVQLHSDSAGSGGGGLVPVAEYVVMLRVVNVPAGKTIVVDFK